MSLEPISDVRVTRGRDRYSDALDVLRGQAADCERLGELNARHRWAYVLGGVAAAAFAGIGYWATRDLIGAAGWCLVSVVMIGIAIVRTIFARRWRRQAAQLRATVERMRQERTIRAGNVPPPPRSTVASWDRPLSDVGGNSR